MEKKKKYRQYTESVVKYEIDADDFLKYIGANTTLESLQELKFEYDQYDHKTVITVKTSKITY
jgi:hypothetical protein